MSLHGAPRLDRGMGQAPADQGSRALFFAPGAARLWWTRGLGWPDGTRTGHRARLAEQRADARSDRRMSIAAGTARDPGGHLHRVSARRLLGGVGGRLGVHLAEFFDRCRTGCAVRALRGAPAGDSDFLRGESGRDRPNPALLLSPLQVWDGGLLALGHRNFLP